MVYRTYRPPFHDLAVRWHATRLALICWRRFLLVMSLLVLHAVSVQAAQGRATGHTAQAASAAAPQQQAQPAVLLPALPTYGLIGADVTLSATLLNTGGPNDLGYGPFVDLVLDRRGADGNDAGLQCDGLALVAGSALLDGAPPADIQVHGGGVDCESEPTAYPHPFLPGNPTVTVPAGHQLVSIRLPVGSYAPDAPPLAIQIQAHIDSFADEQAPLDVYARGGFLYGDSPTGTTPTVTHGDDVVADGWTKTTVIPLVLLATKSYLGPEGEAATGPSHKDGYPLRYEVTAAIAPGQTVTNLVVTDQLPADLVFDGFHSHTPGCTATAPAKSPAAGAVAKLECASATGTVAMSFWFHFDRLGATNTPVINLNNCTPVAAVNDIAVEADWTPLDPRDSAKHVALDPVVDDHTLLNKCVALQKSVKVANDYGAKGPSPVDLVDYTLSFQVTDYAYFADIKIEDFLSDGQSFITANHPPVLTISDGTLAAPLSMNWPWADFQPTSVPSEVCSASYPDDGTPFELTGGSKVTFDVSALLEAQAATQWPTASPSIKQGVLSGAATPQGQGKPAWGTIRFRARINHQFALPQPGPGATGNLHVDKHDPLCNRASLRALRVEVEGINVWAGTNVWATDDSAAALQIVAGDLEKRVVARNDAPDELVLDANTGLYAFSPGDTITFEIAKTIPSADAEDIVIEDWLPAPVLSNGEFNGMTTPLPKCAVNGSIVGNPAPGQACWLLTPTQAPSTVLAPTASVGAGNSLRFEFGDVWAQNIQQRTLIVRLTATVTTDPYADGLLLTNLVRECERNTLGKAYCQAYAAAFQVAAPRLAIRKGVIWTSKDTADTPPHYEPLNDKGPFTGCTLNGVTSNVLGANPNFLGGAPGASVLAGLDAGDEVRFAIVVENFGSAVEGAFDVSVSDKLPPQLTNPTVECVVNGNGTAINHSGALFSAAGLELDDPGSTTLTKGAIDPYDPNDGLNLAIIIVHATIAPNVEAGCYVNEAELLSYAGQEGGADHVAAGLAVNTHAQARVCVGPRAFKRLVGTSEAHTSDAEDGSLAEPRPVAIGEIVRYEVEVTVPEGLSPALEVTDLLPADLVYLPSTAEVTSVDTPIAGVAVGDQPDVKGGPFHCLVGAQPPTFEFGKVMLPGNGATNTPRTFRFRFNALVCNTQNNVDFDETHEVKGNNVAVAAAGQTFPDVNLDWGGQGLPDAYVKIVEPRLTLDKRFRTAQLPADVTLGAMIPYELVVTNAGSATAFEVVLEDVLPAGLSLAGTTSIGMTPPNCAAGMTMASPLQLGIDAMRPGCEVRFRFDAEVTDTACSALVNHATATWMSLPNGTGTPKHQFGAPTFNVTGSQTPGAHGALDGARDGSGGPQGVPNDHAVAADLPICGRVCGVKCEDADQDGTCDPSENLLPGWTIVASQDGAPVATTVTTDGTATMHPGAYCLDALPGDTTIAEQMTPQQQADGWHQTGPQPVPPGTHMLALGFGAEVWDVNFANFKTPPCEVTLSGTKFRDANGNGKRDSGEPGMGGWVITATEPGATTPAFSATTNASGSYVLTLPVGIYYIEEVPKAGYLQTLPKLPRKYEVYVHCDATLPPFEIHETGTYKPIAPDELDFGNQPLIVCPKVPWFLANQRRLYVWGDDPVYSGQIGGVPASASPKSLSTGFKAVAQGFDHTVALLNNGDLVAWGGPPTAKVPAPTTPFIAIAAGNGFTLALDAKGAMHSWRASLGVAEALFSGCPNSLKCSTKPTVTIPGYVAISAGDEVAMAIDEKGNLHSWGPNNFHGQLPGCAAPTAGHCVESSRVYDAVAASGGSTLAISDGDVYAWGFNGNGQLPCSGSGCVMPKSPDPFVAIDINLTHSLALDTQGRIWSWGNFVNALPSGKTGTPYGTGYRAIAAGFDHSLALRADGTLESWGQFYGFSPPITPPKGKFFAIAAGGHEVQTFAAALRCPTLGWGGSVTSQIFLPGTVMNAPLGGVPAVPVPSGPTSTGSPTPTPRFRPTWTPGPTPRPTWTAAPTDGPEPTDEVEPTATPLPPSATPPRPTATASATPTATRPGPTPALVGHVRTDRGCVEDTAEVLFGQGETVPIVVRIDGAAQATVRVMYQWPDGGQERQIDGGTINGGVNYTVSPPLVLPADAPLGLRRLSFQAQQPDQSYRELRRCSFQVVAAARPTATTPAAPPSVTPPRPSATPTRTGQASCLPLSQLPGLAAWWRFEEAGGEVALDAVEVPILNFGTLNGAARRGAGHVGRALRFDGQTAYVDVADHPSLDVVASPRGDFTLDAWVKVPPDATTNGVHVAMVKQASAGGPGYQLYLNSMQPGLQLADASGYTNFGAGVAIPKDDRWHLLAVTVDRDRADGGRFYLDGQAIGEPFDPRVRPGSLENASVLRLGALSFQPTSFYDGWMDEVEFIGSALPAQAIAALYERGTVGKCAPAPVPTSPPLGGGRGQGAAGSPSDALYNPVARRHNRRTYR